jgi:hypothetical protein
MILINFSHSLSEEQITTIETLTSQSVEHVLPVFSHFDDEQPFAEQISVLVDSIGFSSADWETKPILINPPALTFAALALMAELHGRMGYFPSIIRIRPVPESTPRCFEVAEIINLQSVREKSRISR